MKSSIRNILIIVAIVGISAVYANHSWPQAVYNVNYDATATVSLLTDNDTASEEFTCPRNGLTGIHIRFAKMSRETIGSYSWRVEDVSTSTDIASGDVDTSKLAQNGNYVLTFDQQEGSKGHTYRFTVQANDVSEDQSISLYLSEAKANSGTVLCNGEVQQGSLMLKQMIRYFNVETFIVCTVLLLYLFVFMKYMNRLFR